MIKNFVVSTLLVASLPFFLVNLSFAAEVDTYANDKSMQSAKKIVEQYKELRKSCVQAEGDERRSCVAALNDASEEYTEARRALKEAERNKTDNVHFVSFL